MSDIEIKIRQSIKPKEFSRKVMIGRFAEELYNELAKRGYIDHLKNVNQLGPMIINSSSKKSRKDYVNIQFYIHNVLKKREIDKKYKYGYSKEITMSEFEMIKINGREASI